MSVKPLTTGAAESYAQHEEKNGLQIGVRPMTDKQEIKDMFHINLLDNGLLPILVVAENGNPTASYIIAKEKVFVVNETSGVTNVSQIEGIRTGSGGQAMAAAGAVLVAAGSLAAAPLLFEGLKMASDATVIQHNMADKEFYSRTLAPGEKAQGFVYFEFPKKSPPSGNYHIMADIKNSATGEASAFDFPINLTLTK